MKTLASFLDRLRMAGITIRFDDSVPTAHVGLSERGYDLVVGSLWHQVDDQGKIDILAHELAHVVRGDLLAIRKYGVSGSDASIPMDAIINETIPTITSSLGIKVITYNALKDKFQNLSPLYAGWKPMYDIIFGDQNQSGGQPDCSDVGEQFDEHWVDPNAPIEKLIKEHIKTIKGLDKVFDGFDTPEELRDLIEKARQAGRAKSDKSRTISIQPVAIDPKIKKIFDSIGRSFSGVRIHRRTYRRDGRIPELRGAAKLPSLKCLLACDASGSISQETLDYYGGVALMLERKFRVGIAAFASECAPWRPGSSLPSVGYGTLYQPIYGVAAHERADLVVILTDGDNFDNKFPPSNTSFDVFECVTLSRSDVRVRKIR